MTRGGIRRLSLTWTVRSEGVSVYAVSMGGSKKVSTINNRKRSINFPNAHPQHVHPSALQQGRHPLSDPSSCHVKTQLLRIHASERIQRGRYVLTSGQSAAGFNLLDSFVTNVLLSALKGSEKFRCWRNAFCDRTLLWSTSTYRGDVPWRAKQNPLFQPTSPPSSLTFWVSCLRTPIGAAVQRHRPRGQNTIF